MHQHNPTFSTHQEISRLISSKTNKRALASVFQSQNNEGIGQKDGRIGGNFNIDRFTSIQNNEGVAGKGEGAWKDFNACPHSQREAQLDYLKLFLFTY